MHQSPSPFRSLTLKQRARFMRHHPTLSEQMLWHMLRSQRLGVRFVRQVFTRCVVRCGQPGEGRTGRVSYVKIRRRLRERYYMAVG